MTAYLGRRLVQILITFLLFQSLVFFLLLAQPGDLSDQFVENPNVTLDARDDISRQFGLEQPLPIQYLAYMRNFWTGNLGVSWSQFPKPVSEIIGERLPRTVFLFLSTTLLSLWLGFISGKALARKRGGFLEHSSTLVSVTLYMVFTPWLALVMIWLFTFKWGLFPIGTFLDPGQWVGSPWSANRVFGQMLASITMVVLAFGALNILLQYVPAPARRRYRLPGTLILLGLFIGYWAITRMRPYAINIAYHLLLPTVAVTLISYAGVTFSTRNSMLETLNEDYILAAWAKGLPERHVRDRHAARNALLPVMSNLVDSSAFVLTVVIIIEAVFSWPGIGLTYLTAIGVEDVPLATGILLTIGMMALVVYLIADLLHAYLDPRIRY